MPLPKCLQPPRRKTSGSSSTRRRPCRLCNNLDPRGHPNTYYQSESSKQARARLTLVVDALVLSRTKAPDSGGCRFCGVLVRALDTFFEGWRVARQRVFLDVKEKGSIKVGIDQEKWKGEAVEIYSASASSPPWPTLGVVHHIPREAGSDDAFDFARRCIQDCLTNSQHQACKPHAQSPSTTAKRLLDVGRARQPIRLIDTDGNMYQYAALSHRWGSGPILTTTKSNWHKLCSNIPFEHMPPLFQDAVIITRQLGLRYIWIDSLCIIQDSVRDWQTESSKMGGIYENSYVTIAATSSGDGNAQCLATQRKTLKINYINTTGKVFALRARRFYDHHPNVREKEPAKVSGPLTSRAWALQEHVLSTRVLHYTDTELVFECKSSYRCECMPSAKPYVTTPSLIPRAVAKARRNKDPVWTAWHRIVEQYSRRDLTIQSDKLPAISGVASKIEKATGSAYIAGLWKDNLASDLLWSVSPEPTSKLATPILETYRAPTFSWASLSAPISYYTPDPEDQEIFTPTTTLLSSSVSLAGLDPLGAISDASIKVRGPCLSAFLSSTQKENMWEYTLLIKGTSAIRISHDCLLVEQSSHAGQGNTGTTVRRAQLGEPSSEFKASVLCLSVGRYDAWISGLVLGESGRMAGARERLGTFTAGAESFQKAEREDLELV